MIGSLVPPKLLRRVAPRARWTELALVVLAVVPAAFGVLALSLTWGRTLSDPRFLPSYLVCGMPLVLHVVLVATGSRANQLILPIAACLTSIGIVLVTRLVPDSAPRQGLWIALGIATSVVVGAVPWQTRILARFKYLTLCAGMLLVGTTLVLGRDLNGSGDRLWLGAGGFVFQPSEVLKVLGVVFLAGYLAEKRSMLTSHQPKIGPFEVPPAPYLGALTAMWGLCLVVLVVQRDLGSALLFYGVFLAMLYVALNRVDFIVGALLLFGGAGALCYRLFAHVRLRVEVWLDPWIDPLGRSYQIVQALYAMAGGGVWGTGLGNGYPLYVPASHTDYPYVALAEEIGLVGITGLILIYALFVAVGLGVAMSGHDDFRTLLVTGLVALIAFQVVVIVGGNVRLMPLTGVTLPYVSYGGSSMLVSWAIVGLLIRTSDEDARSPKPGVRGRVAGTMPTFEQPIQRLGTLFLGLLFVLLAFSAWWQVVVGDDLSSQSQNPRTMEVARRTVRGRILDRRGSVIVSSDASGTRRLRVPSLGHVVGYQSLQYGLSGIERSEDEALSGRMSAVATAGLRDADGGAVSRFVRDLLGRPRTGFDVVLTIDPDVQSAAARALGTATGAIVALDPRSGAILAMVSQPALMTEAIETRWQSVLADPRRPLINRATQGLYVPGSTFKILTASAAIEAGVRTSSTIVRDPTGETVIDGFRITDAEKPPQPTFDFAHAFAWSSNVAFAEAGLSLGEPRLRDFASRFGIGLAFPVGVDTSASSLSRTTPMSTALLASTAFGQGELLVTPLQVAMIAVAVARDGDLPRPYLVSEVRTDDRTQARIIRKTEPLVTGRAVSPATAGAVRAMMGLAVDEGFSRAAAISGIRVGGKTGTAQSVPGLADHAWFVGIAPLDAPRVVVVVLKEAAGWGAEAAAPVARPVIEAALAAVR